MRTMMAVAARECVDHLECMSTCNLGVFYDRCVGFFGGLKYDMGSSI